MPDRLNGKRLWLRISQLIVVRYTECARYTRSNVDEVLLGHKYGRSRELDFYQKRMKNIEIQGESTIDIEINVEETVARVFVTP